jgi:hypothetical protein
MNYVKDSPLRLLLVDEIRSKVLASLQRLPSRHDGYYDIQYQCLQTANWTKNISFSIKDCFWTWAETLLLFRSTQLELLKRKHLENSTQSLNPRLDDRTNISPTSSRPNQIIYHTRKCYKDGYKHTVVHRRTIDVLDCGPATEKEYQEHPRARKAIVQRSSPPTDAPWTPC